jgi:hypothetical protein
MIEEARFLWFNVGLSSTIDTFMLGSSPGVSNLLARPLSIVIAIPYISPRFVDNICLRLYTNTLVSVSHYTAGENIAGDANTILSLLNCFVNVVEVPFYEHFF